MAIAELVSAEQYLHTSFEHDAEFVGGRVVQRHVPTWEHGSIQGFLVEELRAIGRRLGLFAVPEQRVQTSSDRFRVPDVCVLSDKPKGEPGRRFCHAATVSVHGDTVPGDTVIETLDKVREYLSFGVSWVWVIDPVSRTGQVHGVNSVASVKDGVFSTDQFQVDVTSAEL